MIFGRAAGRGVTSDLRLFNRISNLLAIGVTIKSGPLYSIGSILIVGYFQFSCVSSSYIRPVSFECQIRLELFSRRTHAVLVIRIFPHLGDLNVGETVGIGVGDGVVRVGEYDSSCCCLRSGEVRIRLVVR